MSMSSIEFRQSLRSWILSNTAKVEAFDLTDQTPLLDSQIVNSLQMMELILFLEATLERSIDVTALRPGVFDSIDSICDGFLEPAR